MPIYEFYCSACHTLLNFFSPTVDTDSRPSCPHCAAPDLERKPARFATPRSGGDSQAEAGGLDEARLEQAMAAMADEFEGDAGDDDPRQMGRLMRRFSAAAGLELTPAMQSLVERLEAGGDPDEAEEEMADLDPDAGLDALFRLKQVGAGRARPAPRIDEELHFL
jgi:putative FmdB family regulatory protein